MQLSAVFRGAPPIAVSIHPRKFLRPDSPRFTILPGSKARTLVRSSLLPRLRVFLFCSACIPVLGDMRCAYRCARSARRTRRLFTYASVRRTCTRDAVRSVKTLVFLSPASMRRMTAGAPRPDIWRRQNFDAPLRSHTGTRTAIHHARVHLSNGIGADLSGILTTTLQHVCAYGWRRSHRLSFR